MGTLFVAGDPNAAVRQRGLATAGEAAPSGIPFTQHLMPDGQRNPQWIDRPPEVEARARELIALGFTFHCEMLSDYRTISLTIESPDEDDGDVAIELCPNGPDVLAAVDRLVMNFQPQEED